MRLTLLLGITALCTSVFAATVSAIPQKRESKPGKWHSLYNGKDLTGWHIEGDRGKMEDYKPNGKELQAVGKEMCYLATDKEYGNFELKLDYQMSAGTNSGIGIRTPLGKWPSMDGMEVQILDDASPKHAKEPLDCKSGSIYMIMPPKASPSKGPGEWNHMRILCDGEHVLVEINGVTVLDFQQNEIANKGKGPLALKDRPRKGYIGLQCHRDPIKFKNIVVRELGD